MTASTTCARQLLEQYACNDRPYIPERETPEVIAALTQVVAAADFQTLGVCADNAAEGFSALSCYLLAFGLGVLSLPESEVRGPIYIKYNTQTGKYYTSHYPGTSRGVLVCCHCESPELISDVFGHFPLDLFFCQF